MYEYKVAKVEHAQFRQEQTINEMAKAGWEFMQAVPADPACNAYYLYFRKPAK